MPPCRHAACAVLKYFNRQHQCTYVLVGDLVTEGLGWGVEVGGA